MMYKNKKTISHLHTHTHTLSLYKGYTSTLLYFLILLNWIQFFVHEEKQIERERERQNIHLICIVCAVSDDALFVALTDSQCVG